VNTCAFLPNSNIVSGSHDYSLKIWDIAVIEQNKSIETIQHTTIESILDANVSYDNQRLVIWNNSFAARDNTVKILDTTQQTDTLYIIPTHHQDCINYCAISPDNKFLLTASLDKSLKLWNISNGNELNTYMGHTNQVRCCAFYHHKNWFISGSSDNTIRIWDIVSTQCIFILHGHSDIINSCKISEDDRWLLSSSHDKTARIWDLITFNEVLVLKGHSEPLNYATFSHDSEIIVTASQDCTAKIWLFMSGAENILERAKNGVSLCQLTLKGHYGGIKTVDISRSKLFVITTSNFQDNNSRIWDATSGECIAIVNGADTFSTFLTSNSFIALSKTELKPLLFEIISK